VDHAGRDADRFIRVAAGRPGSPTSWSTSARRRSRHGIERSTSPMKKACST